MSGNVFLLRACGTSSPNQAKRPPCKPLPPPPLFGICMTAIGRHQQLILTRRGGLPRRRALNTLSAPSVDFSKPTSQANVPGARERSGWSANTLVSQQLWTCFLEESIFYFFLKRKERTLCESWFTRGAGERQNPSILGAFCLEHPIKRNATRPLCVFVSVLNQ